MIFEHIWECSQREVRGLYPCSTVLVGEKSGLLFNTFTGRGFDVNYDGARKRAAVIETQLVRTMTKGKTGDGGLVTERLTHHSGADDGVHP